MFDIWYFSMSRLALCPMDLEQMHPAMWATVLAIPIHVPFFEEEGCVAAMVVAVFAHA